MSTNPIISGLEDIPDLQTWIGGAIVIAGIGAVTIGDHTKESSHSALSASDDGRGHRYEESQGIELSNLDSHVQGIRDEESRGEDQERVRGGG
jgi:hypothetical protein